MFSSSDFLPFIDAKCSLPCYHGQLLSKITRSVLYDDDDDDNNNNNNNNNNNLLNSVLSTRIVELLAI
jgi:hypothetical protein